MNFGDVKDKIKIQLQELSNARSNLAEAKSVKQELLDNLKQGDVYKELDDVQRLAENKITQLENEIRTSTLLLHDADAPLPEFVAVKMFTVVNVPDEEKARTWCLSNFTPALKFDRKVFEDAAKKSTIPNELVSVTKEPRVLISAKIGG